MALVYVTMRKRGNAQPTPPRPMRLMRCGLAGAVLLLWAGLAGCAPEIGDECSNSADCDVRGERVCDGTLPGGYCTISGCEEGTCPEDAVCVQFRPTPARLSSTWCMASCGDDGDCRDEYECVRAGDLAEDLAVSLDGDGRRFCAVRDLM